MTNHISENRKQKELLVQELSTKISKASSMIVWDYLGLKSEEMASLRKDITNAKGDNKVYKNTLATVAFKNAGKNEILDALTMGSSFLFTYNDENDSHKILHKVIAASKIVKFKGGYLDGQYYDGEKIKEILGLPGKEELLSMLLSVLQAPMRNLAYSLKQVADSKPAESKPAEQKVEAKPEEAKAEEVKTEETKAEEAPKVDSTEEVKQ